MMYLKNNKKLLKEITNYSNNDSKILKNNSNLITKTSNAEFTPRDLKQYKKQGPVSDIQNNKSYKKIKFFNPKDYKRKLTILQENQKLKKELESYKNQIDQYKIEWINKHDKDEKIKNDLDYFRQYYKLLVINLVNIIKTEKINKKSLKSLKQLFSENLDEPINQGIIEKFYDNYLKSKKVLEKITNKKLKE